MVIDMLLKEIYSEYDYNIEITGVQTDSRFVKPGNLFLPIRGKTLKVMSFLLMPLQRVLLPSSMIRLFTI